MQTTTTDDETEYDVDGVYTAKELAQEIARLLVTNRFGVSAGKPIDYETRSQMTYDAIFKLLNDYDLL